MGKEEEKENLFEGLNLGGDKVVDTSFFEQEPENKEENKEVTKEPVIGKKDNENNKEEENDGTLDTSFFEQETTEDTSINESESDNNSSSPLQTLANTLQDEGLIDIEEGVEIKDSKALLDAWRKKMVDNEYSDLTPEQSTYLKALRNGIPEEEVKANFNNIKALEGLDEETISNNEQLQRTLIAQDYIAKGISPEEATKLANNSVELGNNVDDAKKAYNSLKTIEKNRIIEENKRIEKLKEEEKKKSEERLSNIKETILKKDNWIPGIKINSSTKDKIFKNMTDVVDYTKSGEPINAITKARLDNPENFEIMESFLFTITKGFKDFSKLKNSAKSSAIDDLDKALAATNTGGGTPKPIQSSSSKGLIAALDKFSK